MRKFKIVLITLLVIGLVFVGIYFFTGYFRPKDAGLLIESEPTADVYIDDEQVGKTRYDETLDPGKIVVKLIPESFENPLAPFETQIELVPGVKTIIQHRFGDSDETSETAIISFEKIGGKETELSIISIPDKVQVSVDGSVKGYAPYTTSSITSGEHQLKVNLSGYKEKSLNVRTYEGYKLTAFFQLAEVEGQENLQASPTPEPKEKKITILSTPTGFLRVRKEPSTLSEEVGRVEPKETYDILDTDDETGWYKIEYEEKEEGWVSSDYVELVNDSEESKPSPSPES